MGLIQNGYRDVCGSFRIYGATVHNSAVPQESIGNWHRTGMERNLTAGEGITDQKIGVSVGYRPPDTWIMPQKAGALGSTGGRINGTGSVASPGNLAGGLNAESTLAGSGSINNAAMGLVMFAVASLEGGATVAATMTALYNMSIELSGSGGISADMIYAEAKDIIANLSGTGGLSGTVGAKAGMLAELMGQGGVCCSDLRADGYMSADIAPATTVAASVIASAVWDAAATDMPNGSMGEAVLAGSGGLVPPTPEEVADAVWGYER